MNKLNDIMNELGISKVKLAKYLGVSRQMVYNYLDNDSINDWPKEKRLRLFQLLDVKATDEILKIKIDSDYIMQVEARLNEDNKKSSLLESNGDLKGMKKEEQELLNEIFFLLKERLSEDKTRETIFICKYLYHFLQSLDTSKELKYILGYVSKSAGFSSPKEYAFNEDQQFIFESILYSAMTFYNNGKASKVKLADTHARFEKDIEHKTEARLSRTQELNTAKVQALRELGYNEINENNAAEVLAKIAEIQSRKVS